MKKSMLALASVIALSVGAASCGKKSSNSGSAAPAPQPATITFAQVNTVLAVKCSPCHAQAGTLDDSSQQIPLFVGNETLFNSLAPTAQTLLTTSNQDMLMPPPDPGVQPLTADEKTEILNYLGQQKG